MVKRYDGLAVEGVGVVLIEGKGFRQRRVDGFQHRRDRWWNSGNQAQVGKVEGAVQLASELDAFYGLLQGVEGLHRDLYWLPLLLFQIYTLQQIDALVQLHAEIGVTRHGVAGMERQVQAVKPQRIYRRRWHDKIHPP